MTNYKRRNRAKKVPEKKHRINEQLFIYSKIRVIDQEGQMIGILSPTEALQIATDKELDLIEINPKGEYPIVRMMNYSKFKYLQSKSESANKAKPIKDKTVRVSVRIAPHDLRFQAKKVDGFLAKGFKVKIQVQMQRREKAHPEVAKEVAEQFVAFVEMPYDFESKPTLVADSYFAVLKPNASTKNASAQFLNKNKDLALELDREIEQENRKNDLQTEHQ